MTHSTLSLPVDIPWKRMGVTESMIDTDVGELRFPRPWRSSVAVFYHEPTDLPPEYVNRRVIYLKIACTITNYAPNEDDLYDTLSRLAEKYSFYHSKNFSSNATRSYPCYGALLQASVHPHPHDGEEIPLHDYPYISAFQPRKREMYEAVSESGEIASQSSNQVNVGKQMTNTDSTESYDLDMGYSKSRAGSGGAKVLFGLVEAEGSGAKTDTVNQQKGTIDRNALEDQHIQTTDMSREKRESYSHATTVNHVYSLLQGYHLGTNRAIFFMQPRPHIQNAKFTFIRGLRALEGVQEFFLIVDGPNTMRRLCIEIALETAHLRLERAYRPRIIPLSDLYVGGNLEKTAEAIGLDLNNYAWWRDLLEWNLYFPATRRKFHEAAAGQVADDYWAGIDVNLDDVVRMLQVIEMLPEIGTEDIALIFEEYEHHHQGEFFVAGQRLGACTKPLPEPPTPGGTIGSITTRPPVDVEESVPENISSFRDAIDSSIVFEGRLRDISDSSARSSFASQPEIRARELNAAVGSLNRSLWDSLGSTERFAYGEVPFTESELMLDELAQFVRLLKKGGIQDKPIADIPNLSYQAGRGLGSISRCQNATDIGFLSTETVARELRVGLKEAKKARREMLLAVLDALDERTLDPETRPVDVGRERLEARYPGDRLRKLEESAGVVTNRTRPATRGRRR